jgi:hypothetical protein
MIIAKKLKRCFCLIVSTGSFLIRLQAQTSPAPVTAPAPDFTPRVIDVKAINVDSAVNSKVAYAGDIIRIRITNPIKFLENRPTDKSRLVMYAEGIELRGIYSKWYSEYTNQDIRDHKVPDIGSYSDVAFRLIRNQETKPTWDFFYGNTKNWYANKITLNLSLGWEQMVQLDKGVDPITKKPADTHITIYYYETREFIMWLLTFLVIIIGFLYLAIKTDVLRDSRGGKSVGAYSLSLTQLLFWTTLVIGGFIYSLVLTEIPGVLNSSILLLIGISLSTTGVASIIDLPNTNGNQVPVKAHQSFFRDILSDGSSYSVQRIQTFAWNLVLGVYFIIYTVNSKTMPEFSDTLLFLAGISSASYLGSKVPENKLLQAQAGQPPAPPVTVVAPPVNTGEIASPVTNTNIAVG